MLYRSSLPRAHLATGHEDAKRRTFAGTNRSLSTVQQRSVLKLSMKTLEGSQRDDTATINSPSSDINHQNPDLPSHQPIKYVSSNTLSLLCVRFPQSRLAQRPLPEQYRPLPQIKERLVLRQMHSLSSNHTKSRQGRSASLQQVQGTLRPKVQVHTAGPELEFGGEEERDRV